MESPALPMEREMASVGGSTEERDRHEKNRAKYQAKKAKKAKSKVAREAAAQAKPSDARPRDNVDSAAPSAAEATAALADWSAAGTLTFTALEADDRQTVRLAALQRGLTVKSCGRAATRVLVVKGGEAAEAAAADGGSTDAIAEIKSNRPAWIDFLQANNISEMGADPKRHSVETHMKFYTSVKGGRAAAQPALGAAEDASRTANLFVWVVLSSCSRMLAHLATSGQLPCRVEVLRGEGAVQKCQAKRNNGIALLAARCDSVADAATVAAALVADENLAYPLRKAFVVEEATHDTLDEAAAALAAALDTAAAPAVATAGGSRAAVRLQVWPKTLQGPLLATLPSDPAGWELSPQTAGGLVASVVCLASGVYKVGVSAADTNAANSEKRNHGEVGGNIESQICRAFYKLREAVQVAAVDERFTFKGAMAIDAGAAPGGWTKYLAGDRGCSRVSSPAKSTICT